MSWINVKDRLPSKKRYILVYGDFHINDKQYKETLIASLEMANVHGISWTFKGIDINEQDEIKSWNITHWQPLPEPPEDK